MIARDVSAGERRASLVRYLRRHDLREFTLRQVTRAMSGRTWATTVAVKTVLDLLEADGTVVYPGQVHHGRGRPSEVYRVDA